uniref:Kinase n=1 Tax=Ditylenchus dipsaci TaxID=166011 RepID=A0A915CLK4_9BILA
MFSKSSAPAASVYKILQPSVSESTDTAEVPSTVLKPFKHQVGGHAGIFAVDDHHICKEYNTWEASFYSDMPECLREMTAECCYQAELVFDECLGKYSFEVVNSCKPSRSLAQNPHCQPESCVNYSSPSLGSCKEESEEMFRDVNSGLPNPCNPWAFHCILRTHKKKQNELKSPKKFLMLENLAAKFTRPCIVDLKLGTRQYGDQVTEQKKLLQIFKCATTTSKDLGLRICGLQYYDAKSGMYQCVDKYAGRTFDQKAMRKMLKMMMSDSNGLIRENVCRKLLEKVEKMRKLISKLDGLRLFGTSLLIVFEGEDALIEHNEPEARLIDFAHAIFPTYATEQQHKYAGPDMGCLLGLDNLMIILKSMLETTS